MKAATVCPYGTMNDMESTPQSPSTSIRFSIIVVAFAVHLAAWAGFCALSFAAGSYYLGGEVRVGATLLVLALLAGGAAFVIVRSQPNLAGSVFAATVLAVCGLAGAVPLISSVVPAAADSPVWNVVSAAPVLAIAAVPFLVARAVVHTLRALTEVYGPDSEFSDSPVVLGRNRGAPVVLLTTVGFLIGLALVTIATGGGLAPEPGFSPATLVPIASALGSVAALFALVRALARPMTRRRDTVIGTSGFVTVAAGIYLMTFGAALLYSPEAAMFGDGALLLFVVLCYLSAATVLAIACLWTPRAATVPAKSPVHA